MTMTGLLCGNLPNRCQAAAVLQEITLSVRMGQIAEDNQHPVPHAADDSWLYIFWCPTAIGCRGAKTHTEIGWQREGEAEVSQNRSGNRSSCFPQQWKVLCLMEWCRRNSFRVWTLMQFYFDSIWLIYKKVSDLYSTVFIETQRYLIICLWCILD